MKAVNKIEGNKIASKIADWDWTEILDLIQEGVFAIDKNGNFYCNQVFHKLFGLPDKPIKRVEFFSFIESIVDPSTAATFIDKLQKKECGEVRLSIKSQNGAWSDISISIVESTHSKVTIGLIKNAGISTIDREGELQWLLNSVFEAVEDGIFILEPETMVIKRANQAAYRIFGYSNKTLSQKSVLSLLANQSRVDEITKMISSKLPILKSVHIDLEMKRSNDTIFPALHGIIEITSTDKQVIAWMWIVTDMTQRVFINRALVDLETRYRLLFDRTADPTLIIDANTRKIIDANAAAEAQLLYARSELIGLNMDDITPESRRGEMAKDFSSLGIGESGTIEGLNLTKTGAEIPVQISAVATDFEGRKVFIASCRDISQLRQLEKERLRIEKLDTVRKIAGGLAHEFSQPLQGLTTIVDLLGHPGLTVEAQEELLRKIEPSVVRMVILLEQMKNIVRVETKPYAGSNDIVDIEHST